MSTDVHDMQFPQQSYFVHLSVILILGQEDPLLTAVLT